MTFFEKRFMNLTPKLPHNMAISQAHGSFCNASQYQKQNQRSCNKTCMDKMEYLLTPTILHGKDSNAPQISVMTVVEFHSVTSEIQLIFEFNSAP